MKAGKLLIGLLLLMLSACNEGEKDLPSVEERVSAAKEDLIDRLTNPSSGWRLEYRPVTGSGSYLILLDFKSDGTVRIQSDVGVEDGYFYDQTIPYRVDNGYYMELIFETYAIFHYLFEQDQGTFGAEFEFLYLSEEEGELIFRSKSDRSDVSTITLTPASATDKNLFSREQATQLLQISQGGPIYFGGLPRVFTSHQLYFADQDFSLFWEIDQSKRVLYVDAVVSGQGFSGDQVKTLGIEAGYTFYEGALVTDIPIAFDWNGTQYSLTEFDLNDFSAAGGANFCPSDPSDFPTYTGHTQELGSFELSQTLFNSSGLEFEVKNDGIYSVNAFFIFDNEINSLTDEGGIINEYFPSTGGFLVSFGLESDSIPAYSMGFVVEDESGKGQYYMKEFDVISHVGNRLEIAFKEQYFLSGTPPTGTQSALSAILDEMFSEGVVYIYYTPFDDIPLYRLYNPCNGYEIFLVG